jgi:23S rRNA pseudouridine2605 synthase
MKRRSGPPAGKVSLDRALSKLGFASRTQAARLIAEGRVRVGGQVVTNPKLWVTPETAGIEVDDASVEKAKWRTVLLHKPKGVVTTRSDEKGRATVYASLGKGGAGLMPVGRLDLATSGLLLLTNDNQLSAWVTDPKNAVPRVYLVTVRGLVTPADTRRLIDGVEDAGEKLGAVSVEIRKASGKETHLVVELVEGKNREIRRMLDSLGHEVTRLKRVSFGGLQLGDELEPGEWREVGRDEIERAFPTYQGSSSPSKS